MSQHPTWADYSGTARIILAVVLLIIAAVAGYGGVRLRRPVRLPRPGRGVTNALLTAWVVVIFAFLAALSELTQQARQQNPHQARLTGPIAPVTFTAVGVTFVVIIVLGRSYGWPVRLLGAAIGALAAPMIFEFPFDFIVMARITQVSAAKLVAFFLPLYLIEIVTLILLAASPMVRLRRVTCLGFASMLAVFAIWALFGFGYPSTEPAYALNVVSKILAFLTTVTLFLPPRDPATEPASPAPAPAQAQPSPCRSAKALSSSRCPARSAVVGLMIRRLTPSAARSAASSGVIAMLPQRVYSSASPSRPAARAVSRIRVTWAARCSSLTPPPGK
jgi:hypothetical protein